MTEAGGKAGGLDAGRAAAGLPVRVILGPCADLRAEVFVQTPLSSTPPRRLQIAGDLAGPECRRAITLPVTVPLTDMGAAAGDPLAKAVLTEPAFWTPELPNLYRLTARLVDAGTTVAETTRRIGLRRSGVRGRSLWLEGRRWVPRGVACDPQACDLAALREAGVAAVVADPPESLVQAADEAGLAIVALVERHDGRPIDAAESAARIRDWAAHPSVVMAVLPQGCAEADIVAVAAAARRDKGTMLLARVVAGAEPPPAGVATGIDCLVVALAGDGLPHHAWRDAAPATPLIALRRGLAACAERRDCDRLQADLAAWGLADGRALQPWDWAGYLVS